MTQKLLITGIVFLGIGAVLNVVSIILRLNGL